VKFYFVSRFRRSPGFRPSRGEKETRWEALAGTFYTRVHAHIACACIRPRAPPEFNFQLDLSDRHCQEELGAYFAPLGSYRQLSPTKQILSFRFLRPTCESPKRRGEEIGPLQRIRKIDGL